MMNTEKFLFIGCLLQGALGRQWAVWMPQNIEALSGSCVLIPCRFEIVPTYDKDLVAGAKGIWKKGGIEGKNIFDSNKTENKMKGTLIGDLLMKNCTTILDNFPSSYNDTYLFRLETNHLLLFTFRTGVRINTLDSPPKPKLTSEKEDVMEGTSVSLNCSAAAPCPKLPPNLTWTPSLSDSVDQLQQNEDQTKSVSSVLTFTASHLHHGQKITCRALYTLQQGSIQRTSEASLTLRVLYPPKNTSVSVSPSGSVLEGSSVTLTCSSKANPPVQNYTWYELTVRQMTYKGAGIKLVLQVSDMTSMQLCCMATNNQGTGRSPVVQLNMQYPPKNTTVSVSPSGSVLEGSSVTLTCSSKANPPVQNYTWYKINRRDIEAVGTGDKFVLLVSAAYGGRYFCEALNQRGTQRSETVLLFIGGSKCSLVQHIICGTLVFLYILTVCVGIYKYKSMCKQIKVQQRESGVDSYDRLQISTISSSDYEVIRNEVDARRGTNDAACDYENIKRNNQKAAARIVK